MGLHDADVIRLIEKETWEELMSAVKDGSIDAKQMEMIAILMSGLQI